jgi:hypothetical protein
MSLKKSLLLPAAVIAALAVGSLSACSTSTSDVTTTSSPEADGWSFAISGKDSAFSDLPSEIPYLTDYNESKATGDQTTGRFELALKTGSKNAVKDAGEKLVEGGFTASGKVYTSTKWKVTLEGTSGQVHYTIVKNS